MGLYILISVLILIVCVLMVLVVLVQNSKGGGLASNFASSNQFMGVRKTGIYKVKYKNRLMIVKLLQSRIFNRLPHKINRREQEGLCVFFW